MKSKLLLLAFVGVPLGLPCLLSAQSAQLSGLMADAARGPGPGRGY